MSSIITGLNRQVDSVKNGSHLNSLTQRGHFNLKTIKFKLSMTLGETKE